MLDRTAKRISKEGPDLLIFTIHDSIVRTIGNEDYVKTIMLQDADAILGFVPSV